MTNKISNLDKIVAGSTIAGMTAVTGMAMASISGYQVNHEVFWLTVGLTDGLFVGYVAGYRPNESEENSRISQ